MYKARSIGFAALTAGMLMLTACSSAPEAAPGTTSTPEQTQTSAPATATAVPSLSPSPAPAATPAPSPEATEPTPVAEDPGPPEEGTPPTALEAATTVMRALKNGNMETLAAWVHRDRGVRFSPYAYVDVDKDIVLSQDELKAAMQDPVKREWREFAGTGELIKLTFADYYKRFVYDADFSGKSEVALNQGLGQGTTLNNLNEVYPKETHDFLEYHIAGIDPSLEGMDWRSLRLVFEKNGQDHILVGIIHDQWTP
ncbi:hypothetical protein [Paenibacillus sp. FSL R5-0912]|uniref:hypothetical protein n=1 Tax=Paenibacillus sp. FSL R5-0912 TaxID=1536771 RepID=UPI0004F72160|nr:hypothetical protein [Paenibacillus sp. FSL R5-0912]AIQ39642.1 hypothetical protein R50912_06015 [Paenibacillus sp. FSL R5-0912]